MVTALQPFQFLQDFFFGSICGIGTDNDPEFFIRAVCFFFQPSAEAMAVFLCQFGRQAKFFISCGKNKISSCKIQIRRQCRKFSLHGIPAHLDQKFISRPQWSVSFSSCGKNSSLRFRKGIVTSLSRSDLDKSRLDIGCDIFDLSGVYISKNGFFLIGFQSDLNDPFLLRKSRYCTRNIMDLHPCYDQFTQFPHLMIPALQNAGLHFLPGLHTFPDVSL